MKVMLKELLIHILGVDFRYPVGSYYETSNANFNPNTAWGGTWVQDSKGRVIVGYDSSQTEFNSIGKTGGEKNHTLSYSEMPAHSHRTLINQGASTLGYVGGNYSYAVQNIAFSSGASTSSEGGGGAHNNLQPYTVAYRWHRTA